VTDAAVPVAATRFLRLAIHTCAHGASRDTADTGLEQTLCKLLQAPPNLAGMIGHSLTRIPCAVAFTESLN
jgi:hypothetical protein